MLCWSSGVSFCFPFSRLAFPLVLIFFTPMQNTTDTQSGKEIQVSRRRSEGSEELGRKDLGSRRRSGPFRLTELESGRDM